MIKLRYTRRELWRYFGNAAESLLRGFVRLAWSVVLLAANTALWAREMAVSLVRSHPCAAVGVTFALMAFVAVATHMQMKVRLTTAEWQRDSLALKLDSARMLEAGSHSYFRWEKYGKRDGKEALR